MNSPDFSLSTSPASSPESLQGTIVRWTLAASLGGMLLYTAIEYFIARPDDFPAFAAHHLLHVALIALLVWAASFLVIRKFVITPVNRIFVHLRRMANGRLEYLDAEVQTREVAEVISSVNRLVGRMVRTPDDDAVFRALDHLRTLRSELRNTADRLGDDVVPVMRSLAALEGEMLELIQMEGGGETRPSMHSAATGS